MSIFAEGLHERLKNIFHEFDEYTKRQGIFYSIVADEQDIQGYLVKKRDVDKIEELEDDMRLTCKKNGVHLEVEYRKDGVLFTFTIEAIQDDEIHEGHWEVQAAPYAMSGQKTDDPDRSVSQSILSRKPDARKVRRKGYPIQKSGNPKAGEESVPEDQYKSPTGKHRRNQAMWPSSFNKSKTFGGRTTSENKIKVQRVTKKKDDKDDPYGLEKINMRPIGVFGPVDKRAPDSTLPDRPGGTPLSYGERKPISASFERRLIDALSEEFDSQEYYFPEVVMIDLEKHEDPPDPTEEWDPQSDELLDAGDEWGYGDEYVDINYDVGITTENGDALGLLHAVWDGQRLFFTMDFVLQNKEIIYNKTSMSYEQINVILEMIINVISNERRSRPYDPYKIRMFDKPVDIIYDLKKKFENHMDDWINMGYE